MQITIHQPTLARELALVAPAADRKSTVPILSHVHIAADADGVTLTCTDLEHALVSRVPCAVKHPGAICLPAKRLQSLVAMLSGDVEISVGPNNWATVRAGRSRSRLAGMSAESFPELPAAPDAVFSMDARTLSRTFGRVAFAISQEESRFTLNGALLEVAGSLVRAVATDGHRLALAEQDGATSSAPLTTLVPKAAIGHFAKLADMSEGGATVAVSADDSHLFFAIGSRLLLARKLTGNFPDYARVLPKHEKCVVLDRDEFGAAIKRVAQFADERSRAARFAFRDGEVTISAASMETGESEESVPFSDGAMSLEMGFNAQYILDALGAMNHPKVAVFLADPKLAGELRPMAGAGTESDPYRVGTDYRAVVMPMRV